MKISSNKMQVAFRLSVFDNPAKLNESKYIDTFTLSGDDIKSLLAYQKVVGGKDLYFENKGDKAQAVVIGLIEGDIAVLTLNYKLKYGKVAFTGKVYDILRKNQEGLTVKITEDGTMGKFSFSDENSTVDYYLGTIEETEE
jgi:hypothetical protein